MFFLPTFRPLVFACAATIALAACQSSEERAENHYQSALTLIGEGEAARALVELRNVFDLNGQHREARRLYAATSAEQGNVGESYSQYLLLVEQFPEDLEARLALARLAISRQQWDEVRRHGTAAREMAPDNLEVAIIDANIDYADALEARDEDARREVARAAQALSVETPDDLSLRRIVVDAALRDGDMEAALTEVMISLEAFPEERALYDTQINLLAQLERMDELETTLLDMIERFPGDPQLVGSLVRVYVANDDIASGEAFLRARAEGGDPETAAVRRVDLVRFQLDLNGPEAALVELDRMIETTPDITLRGLRAQIRFNQGDRQEAIAELEDVLEGAEGNLETDEIRVILARMLEQTGNRVGAQRLIEQVLERDSTQVSALKMDANWKIEGDDPDAAISLLRTALDQTPDDFEAMTLMAEAHARNGNGDLSRDMLALAFEASGSGSTEAQRYAAALTEDGRLASAEEVLQEALRAAPGDVGLMVSLADLYIRDGDWGKAQQVETQLRRVATGRADRAADAIEASRLTSEGRTDEAVAFLENLASENSDDIAARIAVVRTRLLAQDIEGALSYVADLRAENPESIPLALIEAAALSSAGQLDAAAAIYTEVVEQEPRIQGAWMGLVRARLAQGDRDGARTAMDQGLEAMPDAMDLLWIKASFLEQAGDQVGALDVYAALYERAPNSAVIANNYASLLSVLKSDDAEMLERAHAVARRLRGAEEPAFQDTYGWISYLRGDYEVALEHLEPAAAGLSQDPLVQYHLGATYAALGRSDEAAAQFDKALAMMEDGTHPQIERVQAARAALDAPAAAEGETDDG